MSEFPVPPHSEIQNSDLPSEFQQIKNFLKGRLAMRKMEMPPRRSYSLLLSGLQTIIPEEVSKSDILRDPQHLQTAQELLMYRVRLNDRLDFEGMEDERVADLVDLTIQEEEKAKNKFNISLKSVSENKQVFIKEVAENMIDEITFTEGWIRNMQSDQTLTFQDADLSRKLVNAISIVGDMAVIFGPNAFNKTLTRVDLEQGDIQDVIDKYAWVLGETPTNPLERAVIIIFNSVIDTQISDDWQDRDIDRKMKVPGYGVCALNMFDGNKKLAERFLRKKKDLHRRRARALGLGRLPAHGASTFFSSIVRLKRFSTEAHKKIGKTAPGTIREKAYSEGRFD